MRFNNYLLIRPAIILGIPCIQGHETGAPNKEKKMEITLTLIYLTEESAFYQKDHDKFLLSEGFALYWERDKLMLHETIRNDDFERNTA